MPASADPAAKARGATVACRHPVRHEQAGCVLYAQISIIWLYVIVTFAVSAMWCSLQGAGRPEEVGQLCNRLAQELQALAAAMRGAALPETILQHADGVLENAGEPPAEDSAVPAHAESDPSLSETRCAPIFCSILSWYARALPV